MRQSSQAIARPPSESAVLRSAADRPNRRPFADACPQPLVRKRLADPRTRGAMKSGTITNGVFCVPAILVLLFGLTGLSFLSPAFAQSVVPDDVRVHKTGYYAPNL